METQRDVVERMLKDEHGCFFKIRGLTRGDGDREVYVDLERVIPSRPGIWYRYNFKFNLTDEIIMLMVKQAELGEEQEVAKREVISEEERKRKVAQVKAREEEFLKKYDVIEDEHGVCHIVERKRRTR